MTSTAMHTPYCCMTCGRMEQREHTAQDVPLSRRWRRRCISKACKGAKRIFMPAKNPITGNYK